MATAPSGPDGQPLKAQKIALNLIKADKDALQPRTGMDQEHQDRMARAYVEGEDIPPPVHLFYDGKFYWLVDGFHRYFAMWSLRHMGPKFQHVRAFVHHGTKQEAIAFAAVANLDSRSKPMSNEDRKKAMWMLMDLPEWRNKCSSHIGKRFGLSPGTARNYWIGYFKSRDLEIPTTVQSKTGSILPTVTRNKSNNLAPAISVGRKATANPNYRASVGGRTIYLGTDPAKARTRLAEAMDAVEAIKKRYETTSLLIKLIASHNIHKEEIYANGTHGVYGLYARSSGDVVFTWEPFRDKSAAPAAFGRAMHARAATGATRAVVLCPVEDGPKDVMDDYTRAYGVEWMTIEDFADSLKSG